MRDGDDPDNTQRMANVARRVAAWYAEPLPDADAVRDRVLSALPAASERGGRGEGAGAWRRWNEKRRVRVSPALALAASLAFIATALVGSRVLSIHGRRVTALRGVAAQSEDQGVTVATSAATGALVQYTVRFVLVAPPGTSEVALVGDFNGWDVTAAPLRRLGDNSTWEVDVAVSAGRHVYAFVVNGTRWVADPSAALAPDDGFGARTSVVVVGGGRTA